MVLFNYGRGRYGRRTMGLGGGKSRFIIAIVLAMVGLVTYFSREKVTNPQTGQTYRVAMSTQEEVALGLRAAPQLAQQMGGAVDPRSDPHARLVAEVGAKLVAGSGVRSTPYAGNFNFYLLDDARTINAFALPGGQVFITRGMLHRLENEAQLAGVLGHEIGHVVGQHGAQQMAKGQLGQMLATAVGVAGSDSGNQAAIAAQMANQLLQLRYGREHESESDTLGLRYMTEAGYDPSAMLGVMKVLPEASRGNRQPEFLQSHPHPQTRIETIERYLKQNYPAGVPPNLTKGQLLN